eukprot:671224-Amphidinium_carterae.1
MMCDTRQVLFREGDMGDNAYIVCEGSVGPAARSCRANNGEECLSHTLYFLEGARWTLIFPCDLLGEEVKS